LKPQNENGLLTYWLCNIYKRCSES